MKKRIMSLLALLMVAVFVLAACGSGESSGAATDQGQAGGNAAAADAADAGDEDEGGEAVVQDAGSVVDWEDMAELEFYYFTFVPPSDLQHVEDAINAITEKEINTHLHMTCLDIGSYIQQIGIMMAGNERVDLMLSGFATASFSSMMAQHQLMDITEYIDDYGPNIKAVCGDLLKACEMDGGIYATPTYRNLNSYMHISMRKDVLEDLGLLEKAETMTSVDEYIEILEAVHNSEKWNYLRPLQVSNGSSFIQAMFTLPGNFADLDAYDQLGDQIGVVEADLNGNIRLVQGTEEYASAAAKLREMNDKGLIFLDVSGDSDSMENRIKDDLIFSFTSTAEFGLEETLPQLSERDLVVRAIGNAPISSSNITKFCYEVPFTSEEPAAAVAFLNLAYVNPEINSLIAWGVEGVDYEIIDGVAHYIGDDAGNASYHMFDYIVPNCFLLPPWDGHTADFYERAKADMDACTLSPYLGFVANLDDISTEMASVSNVLNEYNLQIYSGQASEDSYKEFLAKLDSVGVQKIIDTYQEQLSAWIAAQ